MHRPRIRIIRKKKKSLKEKVKELVLKPKIASGIIGLSIIVAILMIISSLPGDLKNMDTIGRGKRIDFLKEKVEILNKRHIKDLLKDYTDGFCLFAINDDAILFTEKYGLSKRFEVNWSNTTFHSTNDRIEIALPPINDKKNDLRIKSSTIIIRPNKDYSLNAIEGTSIIQKAEIFYFEDYGNIIIAGIQDRLN